MNAAVAMMKLMAQVRAATPNGPGFIMSVPVPDDRYAPGTYFVQPVPLLVGRGARDQIAYIRISEFRRTTH